MSCLPYLCLFVQYIVVVSTLFVGGHMSCLPYLCLFVQYIVVVSTLFVGGLISHLPYLCLLVHVYSGCIYFVCRRAHVSFTLFVFVCTCI
jgi:hypothetical protein